MIFTVLFPLLCILCLALIVAFIFPLPFSLRVKFIRNASRLFKAFLIIFGILLIFFIQEYLNQRKLGKQLVGNNVIGVSTNFIASNYFRHQRNMYLISIVIVLCIIVLTLTRVSSVFAEQHNNLLEQRRKQKLGKEQNEAQKISNKDGNSRSN